MKTSYIRSGFVIILLIATLSIMRADSPTGYFDLLCLKARSHADQPYQQKASRVPEKLMNPQFSYDQYRDIRFDHTQAWWRDAKLPFEVQFFHPGFIYSKTVQLSEIRNDGVTHPIPFSTDLFNYGPKSKLEGLPADMGFTGFRVHTALNNTEHLDELIVFQGASYFRALGRGMYYGLSARGLAVNTAAPEGEEFPDFTAFYLERPTAESKSLTLYAMLDGPSVTGVYQFIILPGNETLTTVKATLFPRKGAEGKVFGLAPLTSMFWYGENSPDRFNDLRPEVHDSDGLLIERGNGERIWRPLTNPTHIRVSSFSDENPRGFGLAQRDRNYANYEDMEANYNLRPSTWIEPIGSWGAGAVRLVELPTPDETNDNIVAFWVPAQPMKPGESFSFSYNLHWLLETNSNPATAAQVVATRIGFSKTHEPELRRFWVDFALPAGHSAKTSSNLDAMLTVGAGAVLAHQSTQRNPRNDTWRVAFALKPDGSGKPVELRCFLRNGDDVVSETWSYLWTP